LNRKNRVQVNSHDISAIDRDQDSSYAAIEVF
jgi:hypothetical protein